MIIPIDKLESIPDHASRDFNRQYAHYNTSDDNSTYPVFEYTKFPSMQDIFKAVATQSEPPETEVIYSVYYCDVNSDDAILPVIGGADKVSINPEPYYNELTKQNDIYEAFLKFTDFETAYKYAISNPKNE
jgi:hypothetical protein